MRLRGAAFLRTVGGHGWLARTQEFGRSDITAFVMAKASQTQRRLGQADGDRGAVPPRIPVRAGRAGQLVGLGGCRGGFSAGRCPETTGRQASAGATCRRDRSSAVSVRHFAVLTCWFVWARETGEIVMLHLDYVDWRAGEIVTRGKGNRRARLKLPCRRRTGLGGIFAGCASNKRLPPGLLEHARSASCVDFDRRIRDLHRRRLQSWQVGAHRLRHRTATDVPCWRFTAGDQHALQHRILLSIGIYAQLDR